jgi:hypothetical protein
MRGDRVDLRSVAAQPALLLASGRKSRENLLARCFAPPARLCADTAVLMVIGMPIALFAACPANLGAGLHDGAGETRVELRLPAQDAPRSSADITAVQTEPDAADQHVDVALAQASIRASDAALSAIEARLDGRN